MNYLSLLPMSEEQAYYGPIQNHDIYARLLQTPFVSAKGTIAEDMYHLILAQLHFLRSLKIKSDIGLENMEEFRSYSLIHPVKWDNVTLEKYNIEITEADIDRIVSLLKANNTLLSEGNIRDYAKEKAQDVVEHIQTLMQLNRIVDKLIEQNKLEDLPKNLLEGHAQLLEKEYGGTTLKTLAQESAHRELTGGFPHECLCDRTQNRN